MASGSHLSKELFDLIKQIGEARSKQEEDGIIQKELAILKTKIAASNIPPKKMKEYLIRTIYVEMLGHDAAFARIHAVNATHNRTIAGKKIAYLCCTLCLPEDSELLFMLIASLQRDLSSSDHKEVVSALVTICKIVTPDLIHALSDQVVAQLRHENETVRKKVVMVLHRFTRLQPGLVSEYNEHFRKSLCDPDPSVMGASLNFFYDMLIDENTRAYYKDLTPSFVVILRQIVDHRLPRDYDYHRMPAPWMQIKLLEILGLLGSADQRMSEQMYEILRDVMRRADDTGINAGYAIVYQCLQTITQIYPNSALIEDAAQSISRFISSDNHNIKYIGLTALINIVKINPKYAVAHQMQIVDCLEDSDDTIKRQTINLLTKMTNMSNVKVIVDKLMGIIENSESYDQHIRAELVSNIADLAERHSPDSRWYLDAMLKLLEIAGDMISQRIISNFLHLLSEWKDDSELSTYIVNKFFEVLTTNVITDSMVKVSTWVLGEFGEFLDSEANEKVPDVLCKLMNHGFDDELTRGWIITALLKLGTHTGSVKNTVTKYTSSRNTDIQQRCYEYMGVANFASDMSIRDNIAIDPDPGLNFLDGFVQLQMMNGASAYNPTKNALPKETPKQLKLDAYDAPSRGHVPPPVASNPGAPQTRSDFNVKNNLWSKEGYKASAEEPEAQAEAPTTQSYSSTPVQQPYQPSAPDYYRPRPADPIKTEEQRKKENLANALFAGVDETAEIAPQVQIPLGEPQAPQAPQQGTSVDLTDLINL